MIKKHELLDPNSCLNKAADDEMLFVLLGRDPATPVAIRAWIEERVRLGKNEYGDEQIKEAAALAAPRLAPSAAPAGLAEAIRTAVTPLVGAGENDELMQAASEGSKGYVEIVAENGDTIIADITCPTPEAAKILAGAVRERIVDAVLAALARAADALAPIKAPTVAHTLTREEWEALEILLHKVATLNRNPHPTEAMRALLQSVNTKLFGDATKP